MVSFDISRHYKPFVWSAYSIIIIKHLTIAKFTHTKNMQLLINISEKQVQDKSINS